MSKAYKYPLYTDCPGHEFKGRQCPLGHPFPMCIHCGNCPTFICEKETKWNSNMEKCKHEFTGPNCKYHNIASCVHCEFCPKYANNTSFSQDDTVGVQAKISSYKDYGFHWDNIDWASPETEQPQETYECPCQSGGEPHSGGDTWEARWAAKESQAGQWITICAGHKQYYEDSIYFDMVRPKESNTLTAKDLKKAVEQLKSASAKPFIKPFIKPISYKWNYGFSAAIKTGNKETVVDRIRWLLECGQGIIKQVDAGEMPSETVLQAFDKALKELRETGE